MVVEPHQMVTEESNKHQQHQQKGTETSVEHQQELSKIGWSTTQMAHKPRKKKPVVGSPTICGQHNEQRSTNKNCREANSRTGRTSHM